MIQIDTPDQTVNFSYPLNEHVFYPRLLSALCEGLYTMAAERNPNVVTMSSYAPSLQSLNFTNWTPNMIQFDALSTDTVRSASYWQQWLFAHYRGTETLPVTASTGQLNPLFWVASIDEATDAIYVKVINTLNDTVPLNLQLDRSYQSVNGTILTADDLNSFNFVHNQSQVIPRPANGMDASKQAQGLLTWNVPKFSSTVLQLNC